ncbi:phosphoadenosine phosphosulfate reductase domain-containing protein [Acinetobacter higginsii]|uniref:phosphoadenosine phosphosulfate reductase domain-containing protein n=1 Tax=Acinetobacter higginsii TaxID=70347 RepID=UPI0026765828|nr:phosphoadenosine phosphosulfate reductase family protein [Acinetobacter higginsii]MDO3665314.1 phosphoadenosine phosphosulfate reductase family protein [Acinetobacter higginsii]
MIHESALSEIQQGALFVVNHSGGKDSQAMMIKLLECVPNDQILVVHASLGFMEWPGAMELARDQAAAAGVPFIVAKAKKSFLDMVLKRFQERPEVPSFPSPKYRQCTSDLKRGPITREIRHYAKNNGFDRIVNCIGLRAEESVGRAKQEVYKPAAENGKAGRSWFNYLPIHSLNTSEVFRTIQDDGQQPHWAYHDNDRLSCITCIMASAADLTHGAKQNPQVYALMCLVEQVTGYALHASMRRLTDLTGIQPDYSLLTEYQDLVSKFSNTRSYRKLIPVLEVAA